MSKLRFSKVTYKGKPCFEMVGTPCPVCNSTGWCLIVEDQSAVICMREIDDKRPRHIGGTVYKMTDSKIDVENIDWEYTEGEKLQPANVLHKVYTLVASVLGLTEKHKVQLMNERGLSEESIRLRGYFSIGMENAKNQINQQRNGSIWEELFVQNGLPADVWKGVPGFFLEERFSVKTPMFLYDKEGICIPCRNSWGQIVSLQIRIDKESIKNFFHFQSSKKYPYKGIIKKHENGYEYEIFDKFELITRGFTEYKEFVFMHRGQEVLAKVKETPKYLFVSSLGRKNGTSAASQPHFSYIDEILAQARFDENGFAKVNLFKKMDKKSVMITEGLLKADIIAENLPNTKLGKLSQVVVGIAGVNVWERASYQLRKENVKRIFSAFDQDFVENNTVYANMVDMITNFNQSGVETYALTWEIGKGLDDCMTSQASDDEKNYRIHQY
ncbi:TPA: DUF3854 domain-containing protein [Streptococcus suis]|nr:DUF3854 domain-containing protein [Streptococcus suis]